jgi:hypothetical protein
MRIILCLLALLLPACAQYTTPGGPADFSSLGLTPQAKAALTDASVQALLDKRPLVTFPAAIAIARVQAGNYDSYSYHRYAPLTPRGAYSLITFQDVETDSDFLALTRLPQVSGVAPIRRILLDRELHSDLELRNAAAKLHANLLLLYTFDTLFNTETRVRPLSVISLGLFPNEKAKVSSTASALLMDVNNGYIYGVLEATATNDQLTNAWESDQALDDARKKAERQAFQELLAQFKTQWPAIVAQYHHPPAHVAP